MTPHGLVGVDAERDPQSMQDASSLRTAQPAEATFRATEETPLLQPGPNNNQPPRRRRRKCLSITLGITIILTTLCILFFAICSPFQFITFFNTLSNRILQSPIWSTDGQPGWWYRLFIHPSHTRDCKIRKANRYTSFNSTAWWHSGRVTPEKWSQSEMELRTIPEYVLEYAPLIHLYSDEEFWPGDIAEHLVHTTPYLNYTPIAGCEADYNLSNLHRLNQYGQYTYLQSNDNVEDRPKWLGGEKNIPVLRDGSVGAMLETEGREKGGDGPAAAGDADFQAYVDEALRESYISSNDEAKPASPHPRQPGRRKRSPIPPAPPSSVPPPPQRRGGRSDAPVILLVIPKEDGIVDAFWFFFYSYNLGNKVLNIRFGDHVGDWEHTLVRFKNGEPDSLFFSEHFFGEAWSYNAVEKIGKRPVGYSGVGTHAMYGTPGVHRYILPLGLLHDVTDRGPLWDPALNMHAYTYNASNDVLRASTLNPFSPISWFYFGGHWGDKAYPLSDSRQYRFAGEKHYTSGPIGPRFKNLRRKKVCQSWRGECVIKHWRPGQGVDGDGNEGEEARNVTSLMEEHDALRVLGEGGMESEEISEEEWDAFNMPGAGELDDGFG